jgi:hypothetical protein
MVVTVKVVPGGVDPLSPEARSSCVGGIPGTDGNGDAKLGSVWVLVWEWVDLGDETVRQDERVDLAGEVLAGPKRWIIAGELDVLSVEGDLDVVYTRRKLSV